MRFLKLLTLASVTALVLAAQSPAPPTGAVLLFKAHAVGYQVYGCEANGDWSKAEPVAALVTPTGDIFRHFRDATLKAPAWQAADDSKIYAILKDGKPDRSIPSAAPNSIPQLGLVTSSQAPGILAHVAYVLRLATKGGGHPAGPCTLSAGTRLPVSYEADYAFYQSAKGL